MRTLTFVFSCYFFIIMAKQAIIAMALSKKNTKYKQNIKQKQNLLKQKKNLNSWLIWKEKNGFNTFVFYWLIKLFKMLCVCLFLCCCFLWRLEVNMYASLYLIKIEIGNWVKRERKLFYAYISIIHTHFYTYEHIYI